MKYLITESQLEAFLLRRFTMDELEALRDDYNYIMDEEDFEDSADRDDYAYELIEDISSFFSLQEYDSEQVIGRWVENTLQVRVTNTDYEFVAHPGMVENTP